MSASALYELQISEGESSNGPDGEQLMSSKSNSQGDTSAKNEKSKDKRQGENEAGATGVLLFWGPPA